MELPYVPRTGQMELVEAVETTMAAGQHGIFEAATGTGKTIAALVGALRAAQTSHKRVLYLTRTNSQQNPVAAEHARLRDQGAGLFVPFMGRRQYCPLLRADERFRDGTAEELGRLCQDAKRKAVLAVERGEPVEGACPYYAGLLAAEPGTVRAHLETETSPGALAAALEGDGLCPYEALKERLIDADVVAVPYVFLVDGRLRQALLHWMGADLQDVHVIIDEAHNLPENARDHHSPRLAQGTLLRAIKEAEEYHDPVLAGDLLSTSLLHAFQGALHDLADEYVREEDGRLPPGALEEALLQRLRMASPRMLQAAADLETWGDVIREDRRHKGRLPRSYLGAVGAFLRLWWQTGDAPYAHIIVGGEKPALEAVLLEPAEVLDWLRDAASTIHMSGTLVPTRHYRTLCGLEAVEKVMPTPFTADQLQVIGLQGVHRRWEEHRRDPRHSIAQQEAAVQWLQPRPGKTALFFPSHAMLQATLEDGFLDRLDRPFHAEGADMTTPELMALVESFRRDPRSAVLLGVMGGRLTEGIDLPGELLDQIVLFGVPYPRPTARLQALIDHGERRHGSGWSTMVHDVVGRRLRQAVGRLVRGPDDHGEALILDERVARFRTHLPMLKMVEDVAEDPGSEDGFQKASTVSVAGRPRT